MRVFFLCRSYGEGWKEVDLAESDSGYGNCSGRIAGSANSAAAMVMRLVKKKLLVVILFGRQESELDILSIVR